jgi:hypothetical protein
VKQNYKQTVSCTEDIGFKRMERTFFHAGATAVRQIVKINGNAKFRADETTENEKGNRQVMLKVDIEY